MTLLEREDKEKPELHCSPEAGCNPVLHLCSLQSSLSITVLRLSLVALVSQQPLNLSLGLKRPCVPCYRSTPPVLDSSCNLVTSKVTQIHLDIFIHSFIHQVNINLIIWQTLSYVNCYGLKYALLSSCVEFCFFFFSPPVEVLISYVMVFEGEVFEVFGR